MTPMSLLKLGKNKYIVEPNLNKQNLNKSKEWDMFQNFLLILERK